MSDDAAYKVVLAYAPDDRGEGLAWRARVYLVNNDYAPANTVWGRDRDTTLLHAREWIKRSIEHGDPETVLLDRNGDIVPAGYSEKVAR